MGESATDQDERGAKEQSTSANSAELRPRREAPTARFRRDRLRIDDTLDAHRGRSWQCAELRERIGGVAERPAKTTGEVEENNAMEMSERHSRTGACVVVPQSAIRFGKERAAA
jgi:hypothetical protein